MFLVSYKIKCHLCLEEKKKNRARKGGEVNRMRFRRLQAWVLFQQQPLEHRRFLRLLGYKWPETSMLAKRSLENGRGEFRAEIQPICARPPV